MSAPFCFGNGGGGGDCRWPSSDVGGEDHPGLETPLLCVVFPLVAAIEGDEGGSGERVK